MCSDKHFDDSVVNKSTTRSTSGGDDNNIKEEAIVVRNVANYASIETIETTQQRSTLRELTVQRSSFVGASWVGAQLGWALQRGMVVSKPSTYPTNTPTTSLIHSLTCSHHTTTLTYSIHAAIGLAASSSQVEPHLD